jgi:hypothetical protein
MVEAAMRVAALTAFIDAAAERGLEFDGDSR